MYASKKNYLLAVATAGTFTHRRLDGLATASGLAPLDIEFGEKSPDLLPKAEAARDWIAKDPVVAAAFVGPSGAGVKAWVRIPLVPNDAAYKPIIAEAIKYFNVTYHAAVVTDAHT